MKERVAEVEAFTLVEVVLALAVASFCLVVLMGLFTSGLTSSRKSNEDTRLAALTWTVANEIRATNIYNCSTNNSRSATTFTSYVNWYDAYGDPTNSANAYFECQVMETNTGGLPVTNTSPASPSIQMAQVIISYPATANPAPFAMTNYVLIPPGY